MSNYPAGVTGNEPAIAGYPEGSYSAPTCNGTLPDDARVQPLDLQDRLLAIQNLISEGVFAMASYRIGQLTVECLLMPLAVDVECLWEGRVDAQWDGDRRGNGTFFWTCPRCGNENSDDREAGDDHPDL